VSPRGHGESDKRDRGHAVDDFARDVVELDAFKIDRGYSSATQDRGIFH
jgi:hypothetical protein